MYLQDPPDEITAPAPRLPVDARATSDALVRLEGIRFSYDQKTYAVDHVDLDIPRGKVTAIIGPSGCGKSTILSMLAGLRAPSAGHIRWDQRAVSTARDSGDRLLTLVFQKDTVLPWLTVEQNVGFGLRYLRNLSRREQTDRIEELLAMVGLEDVKKKYPYELSGGMRRRVAFLTGVAPHPQLLLLDEPFSSLDEPSRVSIHADVLSIVKRLGMSVVIVTHDLGEAVSLADSVVLLSRAPSTVVKRTPITLGGERDVFTLRQSDVYQTLYADLWRDLSVQSWPSGLTGKAMHHGN